MWKCNNTGSQVNKRKKKEFNVREKTAIDKYVEETRRRLRLLATVDPYSNVATAQEKAYSQLVDQAEALYTANAASMIQLRPDMKDRINGLIASLLGEKHRLILDPNVLSYSGEVRNTLAENRRVATNMLDLAGRMAVTERLEPFTRVLNQLSKDKGLSGEAVQEILLDVVEHSQIPKQRSVYGISNGMEIFNARRYQAFEKRMADNGFTPTEVESLVSQAFNVSSAFDEVRAVADALGVHVDNIQGIGYFPRIASRDYAMRLNSYVLDNSLREQLRGNNFTLNSVWQLARTTNHYVPADDFLASHLVGLNGDVAKLRELLSDPVEWRNYLHNTLSAEQVDQLVDSGIFKKLPMTGREVFEYMTKQYDLPYKGLSEMFVLDPKRALDTYAGELKKSVSNSSMGRTVLSDGITKGWAVPESVVSSLGEDAKNFVPIGNIGLERWGIELPPEAGQLYVHQIVADQWKSMVRVSGSPTDLSNMARFWHFVSSGLNKSVLLASNVMYVGRLAMGGLISAVSAGADTTRLLPAMFDVMRSAHDGLNAFDNVQPYIKDGSRWLTKREALEKFLLKRGTQVAPLTPGIANGRAVLEEVNPLNARRALNYLWNYANAFKDPVEGTLRGGEYLVSLFEHGLGTAFAPLATLGNLIETSQKWATLVSVMERHDFTQALYGHKFSTIDDALKHIDNYFPQFDDVGLVTSFIGRYIRPFASFAMVNPPMQIRNMLRNPSHYIAYQRLLQLWNHEQEGNDPIPEGGFKQYELDQYPIVLQRDGSNGQLIALLPTNYDPILDTVSFLDKTTNDVRRLVFGQKAGTAAEQRDQVLGKKGWSEWLGDVFQHSYYANITGLFTGIDPLTGEKRQTKPLDENSYLGVPMSHTLRAILSFFPPVDALNRMNPGGVFGYKEVKDKNGNVIRPEQLSVFGTARSDNDPRQLAWQETEHNWLARTMLLAGANIKVVDTAHNMAMTYNDVKAATAELNSVIFEAQKQLAVEKPKLTQDAYNKRVQDINQHIDSWIQLQLDQGRVEQYMYDHHISPTSVDKKLRDAGIAVRGLPLPSSDYLNRVLEQGLQMRRQQP